MRKDQSLYPFDHCLACGGPVKIETGGNSEGHYIEQVTCLRGCDNCFSAWADRVGLTPRPEWTREPSHARTGFVYT